MASVTSRYARALADVVFDRKMDAVAVQEQLRSLMEIVNSSADLRRVWESPAIPAEQKRQLLDAIVARSGTSKIVRNFIAVLIDHRRIDSAAHERCEPVRCRFDCAENHILLRIDAALGQQVAGHLVQCRAEARHSDLFSAF